MFTKTIFSHYKMFCVVAYKFLQQLRLQSYLLSGNPNLTWKEETHFPNSDFLGGIFLISAAI